MEETIRQWRTIARGLGHNPDLTPRQVRSLRADINLLTKQRLRWSRLGTEEVPVAAGVTVVRQRRDTRKHKGRLRGGSRWATDPRSYGPCPICCRELPHVGHAARMHHGHMAYKRRGLKQTWARMRAGQHRPWEVSSPRKRAEGHARRLAFFLANVPDHVVRVLGRAAIDAVVTAYGTNYDYIQYERWIRNRYGAGRKRPERKVLDTGATARLASG